METCCICLEAIHDGEKAAVLTKKGSDSINAKRLIAVEPGETAHQKCRKDFCRPMKKNATWRKKATVVKKNAPVISRRCVTTAFDYKENCIFCGLTAKYDGKKRGFDVNPIETQEFQNSLAQVCKARNDEWSITVLGRIEYALDLCAADAVYHKACSVNFRTGKQIPHKYVANSTPNKTKGLRKGRQKTLLKTQHFWTLRILSRKMMRRRLQWMTWQRRWKNFSKIQRNKLIVVCTWKRGYETILVIELW